MSTERDGAKFKRLREAQRPRLTGQAVAKLVGCSQSEVSRFERGVLVGGPKADRLRKLLATWEAEQPAPENTGGNVFVALADDLDAVSSFLRRNDKRLDGVKAQKVGALVALLQAYAKAISMEQ